LSIDFNNAIMKKLLLWIYLSSTSLYAQEQMAIWTFPAVANASSTDFTPTTHQLNSTPTVTQYYQVIDDNGKGGVAYTDVLAVNHVASDAIAWDDLKGTGTDAELWFRMNTTGWTGLNIRFDYRSDSALGFDVDYSTDNGSSWSTIAFQSSLISGYTWQEKMLDLSSITGLNNQSSVIIRFAAFDDTGNDRIVFDNIEITGNQIVETPGVPYILADTILDNRFTNLSQYYIGSLNATISDPTDPASVNGVTFLLRDSDTPLNTLNIALASTNLAVVPLAGLNLTTINDSIRRLFIQPASVGYSDITLTVSDGVSSNDYLIKYAASAVPYDIPNTEFHTGYADASTSLGVGDNYILIANDESNNLLLYHKDSSGIYQNTFDVGTPMGLSLEGDFEASFRKDNKAYWMGSLGNSKSGNIRPDRHMFFSTTISGSGINTSVSYEGSYSIRNDVIAWGDAQGYNFTASAAEGQIPKQIDGLNVEGLALGPDNLSMYIGFRAPLVPATGPNARTKALICPVENFETWYNNGSPVGAPTFGNPIELDLGGRSIRSIERNANGDYIIIAGDYDSGNFTTELYYWTGNPVDLPVLLNSDLTDLNPEGIVNFPSPFSDGDYIEIVSDDGTYDWYNDATEAKSLPEQNWKKFRTVTVQTSGGPVTCLATNSTTTIVACNSYLWTDGNTYTSSGSYLQTLTNAAGCDSVATLNLTINQTTASTTTVVACGSYLWTDGNTYTSSGSYLQTLTNAAGCDSVATLNLTINQPTASTTTVVACGSYLWTDGNTYTSSGSYLQTLTNAAGCDSVATLNLTINQPTASTTTIVACDSYLWTDGNTYTASGSYLQTLTNAAGCDSVATLNLTINQPTASTTTVVACGSYLWTDGNTYTSSGSYLQTLTNAAGCDSVATLNLTINQPTASTTTIVACDSYLWTDGNTYTASGSYLQTLTNAAGCDSVATLNLTINQPTTSTTTIVACGSYLWTDGNTYTSSGSYLQTLTNAAGCDSVATLNLTINQPTASTTTIVACDSYLWTDGNTYTSSGSYLQTLANAAGCDSVATFNLTINQSTDTTIVVQAIDEYTLNSTTYTSSGIYTQNFTNAMGCDSLVILDLSLEFTGLSETSLTSISIHPNPGFGVFEIKGLDELVISTMKLFDVAGKSVDFQLNISELDLTHLAPGSYYLLILHDKGHSRLKIMKQ
jgi:hypothetical protein